MKIQHNLWAMNANRNIKINTGKSAKTTEKLSSGYRINRAADDAAGLSISEKMRRLIRGLTQASRNCQDGISMVQTAEGALNEVHDMLQRMNELAVQSANGTNAEADREALQQEFAQIQEEIDRVSQTTTFNAMRLFADDDSSAGITNAGGTNGANNTNGTNSTNGTNNSNTPSVTGLDEMGQQASVMRMMSLRSVAAVAETSVTVGDFTLTGVGLVEGEDYSYSNDTLTILSSKDITISGTTTKDHIDIGANVTANVTIENLNIDVSSKDWTSAIYVNTNNGVLNLTLSESNQLKSGYNSAGLSVGSGATLVITEQSSGSLEARGGLGASGIGGGYGGAKVGTVVINNGTVNAYGGGSNSDRGVYHGGCGIGGSNGTITINGGSINAQGGDGPGAGLGGNNTSVLITGGSVYARGTWGYADIGGNGGDAGVLSTGAFGTATIDAPNIGNDSMKSEWNGKINGNVYGTSVSTGNGNIDLTGLSGTIKIMDGGYIIGSTKYKYTGDYNISGNGENVEIILDGITSSSQLNIADNTTAKVVVNGENTVGLINVASSSNLNLEGTGTLNTDILNKGITTVGSEVTVNGLITIAGDGVIDLSKATGDIEIFEGGYKIGDQGYAYSGNISLSGTTTHGITVSTDANIILTDDATVNNITVDSGKTLSINGDKKLIVNGAFTNNGTVVNNSTIVKGGTITGEENISGTGKIVNKGTGNINLSTLTDTLTITDTGYKIGSVEYAYDGDYVFTGTTSNSLSIKSNANITFNNVTCNQGFGIWETGVTVNVTLVGDNYLAGLTVANDSTLNLLGDGTLTVGQSVSVYGDCALNIGENVTFTSNGYMIVSDAAEVNNDGTLNNNGTLSNYGELENNGEVNNGTGSKIENLYGDIKNNSGGTITNNGSITNDDNSTITNNGEINNSSGSIANNGAITNSGTISGTEVEGTPPVTQVSGNINLSNLSDTLTITNTGYKIGNTEYAYTGSYTFSGSTTQEIVVENDADISLDNVTGTKFTVKDNSTVNVKLNGTSEMNEVIVESGSTLNTSGTGTLKVKTKLDNDGTVNIGSGTTLENDGTIENSNTINNNGTLDNDGTLKNDGTLNNNTGATVENDGTLNNNGILKNDGTLNNNSGGTIENDGALDNNGTLKNDGTFKNNASGTLDNSGNLKNDGTLENNGGVNNTGTVYNDGGTLNNSGEIDNSGTLKNDGTIDNSGGTVENNSGGTIDNGIGSTFDNSNGTVEDNGGTINGTITGNQPTTGGGSGGTGGGTGGGSGTGGATAGTAKNSWWIQAGAEAGQGINIEIGAMNTKVLGIDKGTVNILTQESSGNAITAVSGAIEKLSEQRSRLGAYQNRLEHTIYNLDNIVENTTAAESQIRDADMAELMVEHANNNIIMQAAQAMLAQANHQPDGVLQLLQ